MVDIPGGPTAVEYLLQSLPGMIGHGAGLACVKKVDGALDNVAYLIELNPA